MQKSDAFMCTGSARSGINSHIKINKKLRLSAFAASAFLFVFAGLAVFPVANTPVDTFAAEQGQSETSLTISTEDLELAFGVDAINGSFSSESANVSVATNNISGYTLNIVNGNTGNDATKLVGENKSFNTISSATSETDFAAESATTMNGLWGYKPSKVNGESNADYLPAPTEQTTIESTTAPNAQANVYEIALGARADMSYEAGGYTNTFIITAIANPVRYTISFDDNTEDEVTNMPSEQGGTTVGTVVSLASDVPVRDGYDFAGWCDGTASGADCTGTVYQPGDDYAIDQTTANNVTLYALWGSDAVTFDEAFAAAEKTKDTTSDKYKMQDMTPEICEAVTDGQTTILVDTRDGTIYNVVKALDHRCWLADNLALDLTAVNASTNITTANTNADADSLTSLFSGNRANGGQYATAGVSNWTSSYSYSAPLINVSNKDVLPTTYNGTDEPLASTVTSENWKVGVYYNYCAASAGSYCYGSGTSASTTDSTAVDKPNTAIDAEYDICPSGWRMPTGFSYDATNRPDGGEYLALYNAYPSISGGDNQYTRVRKALRLPLSGRFFNGSVGSQGSNGLFWSATYNSSYSMYDLDINTSDIYPQNNYYRYYGLSIRCVAKTGTEPAPVDPDNPVQPYPEDPCNSNPDCDATSGVTLQRAYEMAYTAAHKGMYEETTPGSNTYQYIDSWNGGQYQGEGRDVRFLIQDMTPEICNTATVINSQALVLDIRDQTSYYIVKAADGRCWMQDNLALDAVASKANLSPTNTNATQAAIDNFKNGGNPDGNAGWSTGAVSYETSSSVYNQPRINVESISTVPQGSSDPLVDLANTEQWKVGVYYNYCAASIGTYCYADGQGVDKNPNSAIDADQDICPAGWRMPTGGPIGTAGTTTEGGGEYQTLANAYPSISGGDSQYTRVRKALRLPLSGRFYNGSVRNQGSYGYFWSSTYYDSYNMYYLGIGTSTVFPQYGSSRYNGQSIRCIAK